MLCSLSILDHDSVLFSVFGLYCTWLYSSQKWRSGEARIYNEIAFRSDVMMKNIDLTTTVRHSRSNHKSRHTSVCRSEVRGWDREGRLERTNKWVAWLASSCCSWTCLPALQSFDTCTKKQFEKSRDGRNGQTGEKQSIHFFIYKETDTAALPRTFTDQGNGTMWLTWKRAWSRDRGWSVGDVVTVAELHVSDQHNLRGSHTSWCVDDML